MDSLLYSQLNCVAVIAVFPCRSNEPGECNVIITNRSEGQTYENVLDLKAVLIEFYFRHWGAAEQVLNTTIITFFEAIMC